MKAGPVTLTPDSVMTAGTPFEKPKIADR